MPAAHAAAALTASAAARRRARHAAAALLPPVLPYLPRHTCPLRSAVSPSLPEANAAAGVLPEPFPASHWKATLQRGAKCLLVPTEAAAQELVDVIGQERFNGATVVNLNAGPGNFARFLYNNTAARVVCVNFANVFDTELQNMCDASNGRISSVVANPVHYLRWLSGPSDLGHLEQRSWSADRPPLLVLGSNFTSSVHHTCFLCIGLMTERSGVWKYGRVPLYLIVPDVNDLRRLKDDHGETAGSRMRDVLPFRILDYIADISIRPISAAFHRIGSSRAVQNMYLVSIEPKPITIVPQGAAGVLHYVMKSLNRTPKKPLRTAITSLAAGAEYILSDFSSSPHIRPIDLTVAQLVELARLYDCWPFRPPLENAFQE